MKTFQWLLGIGAVAAGVLGFLSLCIAAGAELPVQKTSAIFSLTILLAIVVIALRLVSRGEGRTLTHGAVPLAMLAAVGTVMALTAGYQLSYYIMLPVDLLSFAESPFVADILKLRLGAPIYASPTDNNNYPYTPGTQILTYFVSSAFGNGDSIPFYRAVQFSYVILAAVVATSLCDLLAQKFLSAAAYR
ncbi:MAG: hypothetical protein ACREQP_04615, partial [Candidatus Binatia bacterium]